MTKQDFLKKLEGSLANIPARERKDILYDYEEHFVGGAANGKSESEIAADLGNPEAIAKEIFADYHVTQAVENISVHNIVRAVLATVSLGFLNLVFVLGPLIGVTGVLIAFYLVAIVLISIPLLMLKSGFPSGIDGVLSWLFTSMMAAGGGTLLGLSMLLVTRWAGKVFLKYLQFNLQIIRGR